MSITKRANISTGHRAEFRNAGFPVSGTSGTAAGQAAPGDTLYDVTNDLVFINRGSKASPVWTPISFEQENLWGYFEDFRGGQSKALTDTAAALTLTRSGVRVVGDGVAEVDSGAVATQGEGGGQMALTTTDEIGHLAGLATPAGVFQLDAHNAVVLEVVFSANSAITDRAHFVGFTGTLADGLVEPVTVATTTATLVQDDLAGLVQDTGATDGDAWFGVHNKSNAAATQDLTADGDTGPTNLAAAGTFQTVRVELHLATATTVQMIAFVNGAQVYTQADALDEDEEHGAVFYVAAQATAVKVADVRSFNVWAVRP